VISKEKMADSLSILIPWEIDWSLPAGVCGSSRHDGKDCVVVARKIQAEQNFDDEALTRFNLMSARWHRHFPTRPFSHSKSDMTDRRRLNGPLGGTSPPVFASILKGGDGLHKLRPVRMRSPSELRKICK
jgi:hypothetical protein